MTIRQRMTAAYGAAFAAIGMALTIALAYLFHFLHPYWPALDAWLMQTSTWEQICIALAIGVVALAVVNLVDAKFNKGCA